MGWLSYISALLSKLTTKEWLDMPASDYNTDSCQGQKSRWAMSNGIELW